MHDCVQEIYNIDIGFLSTENPFFEEEEYRPEILVALDLTKQLDRLDKEPFSEEDIEDAEHIKEQRLAEQVSQNVD